MEAAGNRPKNVGYKRILLFTNDQDPSRGDITFKQKCIEKSKDMMQADITTELFILAPKERFNVDMFWSKVIPVDEEEFTGRISFDFALRFKELKEKGKQCLAL